MTGISITTLEGAATMLEEGAIQALGSSLRGEVIRPGESGYDQARTVWNAMVEKRPALVVRCVGASDVIHAVRFARDHGLLLAVRAGGHNIAGKAVCNGGFLIDLSPMRSVRVDRKSATAWVEPGALLSDFDRETQAFGLTTPVGINSTTGIAGLTLGGGFGWTTRKFGMSIDNLLSADVVTADGELIRASASENPDLFWAIRGGGGNFGIVTAFEFRLHRLGPEVISGLLVYPFADAPELIRRYREFVATAPDELSTWVVMRKAPPLPFLPEEWHGREVFIIAACYAGDMAAGERAVEPLRKIGKPIVDVIGPHVFAGWQAAFDPLLTPGSRNYWKSHNFAELTDGACAKMIDFAGRLPTPECEIFIANLGGAMARVPSDATAYVGREAAFVLNVHTRWQNPADDDRCIAWARDFYRETKPFSSGRVYVNFLTEDEEDRLAGAYAENLGRLREIKAFYDPANRFRVNQNIQPANTVGAAAE